MLQNFIFCIVAFFLTFSLSVTFHFIRTGEKGPVHAKPGHAAKHTNRTSGQQKDRLPSCYVHHECAHNDDETPKLLVVANGNGKGNDNGCVCGRPSSAKGKITRKNGKKKENERKE